MHALWQPHRGLGLCSPGLAMRSSYHPYHHRGSLSDLELRPHRLARTLWWPRGGYGLCSLAWPCARAPPPALPHRPLSPTTSSAHVLWPFPALPRRPRPLLVLPLRPRALTAAIPLGMPQPFAYIYPLRLNSYSDGLLRKNRACTYSSFSS